MKILKLNFQNEAELVTFVLEKFDSVEKWRVGYESRWQRYYETYRSYQEFLPEFWHRSQHFIPYPFALLEGITPEIVEATIGANDFFAVDPADNVNDDEGIKEQAHMMQNMMLYQFNERMDFSRKAVDWIKGTLIFGTGILKDGWREEIEMISTRTWREAEGGRDYEDKEAKSIKSNPYMRPLSILDYYPDPFGRFALDRELVDYDQLEKEEKEGMWAVGTVKALASTSLPTQALAAWRKSSDIKLAEEPAQKLIENMVELVHYWDNGKTITIANRKVVARGMPTNPLPHKTLPYSILTDMPVFGELYGIGEIEAMGDLPEICNMLRNADIDDVLSSINRQYVANQTDAYGLNPDLIINAPDKIIWSNDVNNAIKEIPRHPATGTAREAAGKFHADMKDAIGHFDYARGETPERKETATAIIKLQQAAAKRNMLKIKMFRQTGFKDFLTHVMRNNQYFITESQIIKMFGDKGAEWKRYNPWEINAAMDIVIKGPTDLVADKEKFLVFYEHAIQAEGVWSLLELNKRLAEVFSITAPAELLAPEQPAPEQGGMGGMPGAMGGAPGPQGQGGAPTQQMLAMGGM